MKLSELKLSDYVGFLDKYQKELNLIQDDELKLYKTIVYSYSHYNNLPIPIEIAMEEVIKATYWYATFLDNPLLESYLVDSYDLSSGGYRIQPIIENAEKLNKPEFDKVQSVCLIFADLLDGHNESLYELCAAYLRKSGEPMEVTPERIEFMKSLPLDIAFCVKKYIEDSIKYYGYSANITESGANS